MQLLLQIVLSLATSVLGRGVCDATYLQKEVIVTCLQLKFDNKSVTVSLNEETKNLKKRLVVNESVVPVFKSDKTFEIFINFTVAIFSNIGINEIEPNAFNKMPNLIEMDLSNNNINTISPGIFDYLIKLDKLDLSKNSISDIKVDSFFNSSITSLNISSNHLVSWECVVSMRKIKEIDFSKNNLSSYDLNQMPDSLKVLVLGNNKIEKFIERKNKTSLLTILALNENSIRNLEALPLGHLNSLQKLYLQKNKISSLPGGYFSNLLQLQYLDMSYNNLIVIPTRIFDTNGRLDTLILSHNNIKTLEGIHFENLYALSELYVDYNQLITLNLNALIKPHTHLKNVSLDGNSFSCDFLSDIIEKMLNSHIEVANGEHFNFPNVNGNECYRDYSDDDYPLYKSDRLSLIFGVLAGVIVVLSVPWCLRYYRKKSRRSLLEEMEMEMDQGDPTSYQNGTPFNLSSLNDSGPDTPC